MKNSGLRSMVLAGLGITALALSGCNQIHKGSWFKDGSANEMGARAAVIILQNKAENKGDYNRSVAIGALGRAVRRSSSPRYGNNFQPLDELCFGAPGKGIIQHSEYRGGPTTQAYLGGDTGGGHSAVCSMNNNYLGSL